jgi:CHAT domain-containing protein/tetratricopeptide (TPR) repeat protein
MFRRNTISGSLLLVLAILLSGAKGPEPLSGPALEEGLTLEREIRGGEAHSYPVDLQEGQFLRVLVQEKGIDVAVWLIGPDGKAVTGADSERFDFDCREDLAAVPQSSGSYRVEVRTPQKPVQGSYKLSVQALHAVAGERDKARAEAVWSFWEAFHPSAQGGSERTIRFLERSQELWKQLEERYKQAEVLYFLGYIRRQFPGGSEQAIEDFRQSTRLWESQEGLAPQTWKAVTLYQTGRELQRLRRTEEARNFFSRALSSSRSARNAKWEAYTLNDLGLLEVEEGEVQPGLANLLLAEERARSAGALWPKLFINLGYAYEVLGERQKAIQNYEKALELARKDRKSESIANEANALNNLGDTYYLLGDWETALRYVQQALDLVRSLKDRDSEAKSLTNLGALFVRLERFEDAERALDQAIQLSREVKDSETETLALVHKAELLRRLQRPAEALEIGRVALSRASGSWTAEADARQILGMAYRELGDLKAAREELERATGLARARGDINREAYYTLSQARWDRTSGNLHAALSRIQSAVERIESFRSRVVNPELKAMFLASSQDYYEFQIDTLMTLHAADPTKGFATQALQVSEQARARSLLEILQEAEADILKGVAPALLERERQLRQEVNTLEKRRLDLLDRKELDAQVLAEAEKRVEQARDEYRKFQDELRISSPRYTALTQPQPLKVQEIQAQLLDGRAILLEYKLGKDRSFLWAVSPDSVESFELDGREEIEKAARRWYELLTVRNQRGPKEDVLVWRKRVKAADLEAEQVARDLSRMVLLQVEGKLGNRPVLVVAEGALQYVPFAALPLASTGALLVESNEVVSLPSASALAVLRRDRGERPLPPKLLAILADPVFQKDDERLAPSIPAANTNLASSSSTRGAGNDERESGIDLSSLRRLPYSSQEAQAISKLAPKEKVFVATGFMATRAAATSPDLAQFRNVHFATHGVLDSRRPELSGLVLSLYDQKGVQQDGFLRLNDIYTLHLEADLVVLSACRTALGKEIRGEGLVGLTRGFMYAGAERVLASLWSVEDRATADLMKGFYRGMLREELSPSAALRKTQIEMMKNSYWRSPYFWAGFSLQGEWK